LRQLSPRLDPRCHRPRPARPPPLPPRHCPLSLHRPRGIRAAAARDGGGGGPRRHARGAGHARH
jgi:hypothetical protein